MVILSTSEEWQRQSSLLLQARPTTTRITTKYKIPNLTSPKYSKAKKRKRDTEADDKEDAASTPSVPKAVLSLKTFDPESGVCLIFKTDRAAEVGRLINGLGQLGRHMAALPQKTEDATMKDAATAAQADAQDAAPATNAVPAQPQAGGAGGKKKKKSKK